MNSELKEKCSDAGLKHNYYLDEIISNIYISEINNENKLIVISDAIKKVQKKANLNYLTFDLAKTITDELFLQKLDGSQIREELEDYIRRLVMIDTEIEYSEQLRQIEEIEKELLEYLEKNELIDKEEAILPLCAVSVAKNSIQYWHGVENQKSKYQTLWSKLNLRLNLFMSSNICKEDMKGCFESSAEALILGTIVDIETAVSCIALKSAVASVSEFIFNEKS